MNCFIPSIPGKLPSSEPSTESGWSRYASLIRSVSCGRLASFDRLPNKVAVYVCPGAIPVQLLSVLLRQSDRTAAYGLSIFLLYIYMVSSTMMRAWGPLSCPKLEELSRTSGDRRRLPNIGNPARRTKVDPHIQTGGYFTGGVHLCRSTSRSDLSGLTPEVGGCADLLPRPHRFAGRAERPASDCGPYSR